MAHVTVADIIGEKLREAIAGALHDVQPELDRIAKDGGVAGAHGIVGDIGALSRIFADFALVALVIDPPVGAALETIHAAEHEAGKIGVGSALGYMLGYTAFQALNPLFMPLQHAIAHTFQNEIHTPQDAAALVARGLTTHAHGSQEAKGSAVDQPHFDRLVALATLRPDVGSALELYRRGERDEAFTLGELHHLGYDPDTAKHLLRLSHVLLSPADLALATLRGIMSEADAERYAGRLGVSADDLHTLIGNTGEPPGTEELLFAYRRGFIDRPTLERGIRQSRVRNEWIETIERLRFSPMSTSDAVRGVVEHHLSDDEGKAIAEQNGLTPDHWRPLVESWGRPLAHEQMGSLVHRGKASWAQFDQAMRESDLKDKYTGLARDLTERLLPERLIVSAIHYKALSLTEGSRMLLELGYSEASASVLLKLGLHEQQASAHDLTRSQITNLYADGIFSKEQALTHLEAIGASREVATYTLALIDYQAHAKEVRAEVAVTRTNYLAGTIDAVKAEAEMRTDGLSQAQALHNIEVWNRERRRAARGLTEAQIVKAAKAATITPARAVDDLIALGYSRANADVLLRSNGVPVTE